MCTCVFYCLIRHGAHLCNTNTNKSLLLFNWCPTVLYHYVVVSPKTMYGAKKINKILSFYLPVLRIHDILLWIRIWIRGSMPLTNGSGSCYFRHWSSRCQQKIVFFKFSCLLLFEGTFTSFFKDKKSKKSLSLMIEGSGSGSTPLTNGSGSRRPKNTWSGSATLVDRGCIHKTLYGVKKINKILSFFHSMG